MENRGNNTKDSWEKLRKSGGIAPLSDIKKFLRRGDEEVLSRDELITRIENYFLSCTRTITDEEGRTETIWTIPPTKSGLARAIGCQVQTLLDYIRGSDSKGNPYSEHPDYKRIVANEDFDIIKKAYLILEEYYEMQLPQNKNNAGSIFWLLNSRNKIWSNEQQVKISPEIISNRQNDRPMLLGDQLPHPLPPRKQNIDII